MAHCKRVVGSILTFYVEFVCVCVRMLVSTARRGADERQRPPDQHLAVAADGAVATAAERVGPREDESEQEGEKESKNMAGTLGAKKKGR